MNKKIIYGLIGIGIIGGLFLMKKTVDDYNMNAEPQSYEVQLDSKNKDEDNKEEINKDNIEEESKKEENIKEEEIKKEEIKEEDTSKEKVEYNQDINFTLQDLNGNEVSISDFQGKEVFINFWATWCPNCKVEMPHMQSIWEAFGEEVVVVAVNIGESKDIVQEYIDKEGYTFNVLLDKEKDIAEKFGITAVPTSILLDENGNVIYGVQGAMTYESMLKFINGELRKSY